MLLFLSVYLLATCQLNPWKCKLFWATKNKVKRGGVVGTHIEGLGWEPAHKIAARMCPVEGSFPVTNARDHDPLDVEEP